MPPPPIDPPTPTPTNQYIREVLHATSPPPPIRARFFYSSAIPIDDPLSPLPPPSTTDAIVTRQPPKPFSEYDNFALEHAWQELRKNILKFNEDHGAAIEQEKTHSRSRTRGAMPVPRAAAGRGSDSASSRPGTPSTSVAGRPAAPTSAVVDHALEVGIDVEPEQPPSTNVAGPDLGPDITGTPFVRVPSRGKPTSSVKEERTARPAVRAAQDSYDWEDASHLLGGSGGAAVESGREKKSSRASDTAPRATTAVGVSRLHQVEMPELLMTPIYWTPVHDTAAVVRGTWFYQDTMLPVEPDVANMLEAGYVDLRCWTETWRDELASAVEVGAEGETKILHKLWPDKARRPPAAAREGSPRPSSSGRVSVDRENLLRFATSNLVDPEPNTPEQIRANAVEAAGDIIDIASGAGGPDNKASGTLGYGRAGVIRTYSSYGVIYANEREARILKPSLIPSAYYGRRPFANYIRKGHRLGIPVVRGFDQAIWDKLNPPKAGAKVSRAEQGVATSSSGAPPNRRRKTDPTLAKAERPNVTDLILVIHGIGQKLSQRMESFHFTHAINAFRREINVEVGSKEVKARFRPDMGNIMVLPVNWRHSLSFEDGGYRDGPGDPGVNEFSLKDITPDTLPSVRNIVSDVMLDIPYYMSHHQSKMIAAVIEEANRVYQLWCVNNPGFAQGGRVHIIAHSLGSVMAVDILSRQPTTLPKSLADPTAVDLQAQQLDHFLFNTSNLFLAGSPAGFFLLLKKAQLLPRIDHPSAESADDDPLANSPSICGERGQYGCLALDNLYNIINPYDPVAYRMNAAVDAAYAASLKQATVPSATPGWFGVGTKNSTSTFGGSGNSNGNSHHSAATAAASSSTASGTTTTTTTKPTLLSTTARHPSALEMETHDFPREQIAESRLARLNDNGQIDFFLRYGGGAFEIPYLTMLGAHSSYWIMKDFVRLIATEIGRETGPMGTFLGMRAVKRKKAARNVG